ncbi:MAG: osmoprotectant transport system permease protein [Glaciecola sp.]|jgi:osmoprotectant transport system permease protein
MSAVKTAAPPAPAPTDNDDAAEPASNPGWLRRLADEDLALIVTPLMILTFIGGLALYVGLQDLSSTDERALAPVLLRNQIVEHIALTAWSTFFVILAAIPAGIAVTRPSMRRFTPYVMAAANSGQAVPAYGLLVLLVVILSTGFRTAVLALIVYSVLPVLRNTMVGLDQVDRATIEAARGMGMTPRQVLRRIELPLAVPVILAGVRTALIINVGTASLAFLIGAGGLGETINSGLKLQRDVVILVGASLTAVLALTIDWGAALLERRLRPKGLKA